MQPRRLSRARLPPSLLRPPPPPPPLLPASPFPGVAARGAPGWPLRVRKIGACAGCTRWWATYGPPGLVAAPSRVPLLARAAFVGSPLPHGLAVWTAASNMNSSASQLPVGCNSSPCQSHSDAALRSACSMLDPPSGEHWLSLSQGSLARGQSSLLQGLVHRMSLPTAGRLAWRSLSLTCPSPGPSHIFGSTFEHRFQDRVLPPSQPPLLRLLLARFLPLLLAAFF